MLPDVIGHIGYLFLFIGTRCLVSKKKYGWLFRVGGSLVWAALGVYLELTSIIIWSLIFAANDFMGWKRWNANKDKFKESEGEKSPEVYS